MQTKQKKRLLAALLALTMVLSLLPGAVLAAEDPFAISLTGDCIVIGDADGDSVYYYPSLIPAGKDGIEFTDLADVMEEGMIASFGNAYVEGTNVAPISDAYAIDAFDGDWEIDAAYADLELTNAYGYWIMDDEYDMYYVIVCVESDAGSDTLDVAAADCTVIGEYMGGDVCYCAASVPAGTVNVRFADYEPEEVSMITGLTSGYVEESNLAPLSGAFLVPSSFAQSDSWEPGDGYESFDFTGKCFYAVFDEDYVVTSFVVDLPPAEETETSFTACADGEELPILLAEDAYSYYDYMLGGTRQADLYTVVVPPCAVEAVTLDFGEKSFIAYGYDSSGDYQASYADSATAGQTRVTVPDLDYFVWVQTPYAVDWSSGGEMQFVVTFKPLFTAVVSGTDTALEKISVTKDGYRYLSYFGAESVVDLYTLTIPVGIEAVDFTFADNCLAYNYKGTGTGPVVVDDSGPDAFLGGTVTDFIGGSDTYTRSVDVNGDGVLDYIQVQNTYNEDWSGAELLYAVSFRYVFEAEAGGEALTEISETAGGYTPYGYDPETYEPVALEPVSLYTVKVPAGTESIELRFPESVLAYNYMADGQTYLAGNYEGEALFSGAAAATVAVDANADGIADYIQVQTPYDAAYNTTVLYAVTFAIDGETGESLPFEAEAGGEALTEISKTEGGYTPYSYDPETYEPVALDPVPLYTVKAPAGTESVELRFPEPVLAYNYKADGVTYLAGNYEGDAIFSGAAAAAVAVDANADGVADCIQVQTPYDAAYNTTVLYAVTFAVEGGLAPGQESTVALAAIRDGIAAKFAASGAAGDPNAAWITADMMAYEKLFPETESRLSARQKQDMVDVAIAAIASASSPSDAARNLIALAAMGYDPKRLTTAEGEALDALAVLDGLCFDGSGALTAGAGNVYALPYLLIAYQQMEGCDKQIGALLTAALEKKDGWLATTWGPDGLTPMLLALAPYAENGSVAAVLDEAVRTLAGTQTEDGSVGNAASIGLAMAGLAALGRDPAGFVNADSGKSLADGILPFAASDAAGFEPSSNSYSTEQGFRGLIALAGVSDGAYRIYDFSGNPADRQPAAATPSKAGADFTVAPSSAAVTVKDAAGAEIAPTAANDKSFHLDAGTYTYSVELEGYASVSGEITITQEDAEKAVRKQISVTLEVEEPDEEDTVTVTVRILAHDGASCENKLTYKNDPNRYYSLIRGESCRITLLRADAYASEALLAALNINGLEYELEGNGYFSMIGGYAETEHGPFSGWLYMVDGVMADVSADLFRFSGDAEMVWFYTDDYSRDYGSEEWNDLPDESGDTGASSGSSSGSGSGPETAEPAGAEITVASETEEGEARAEVTEETIASALAGTENAETLTVSMDTGEADSASLAISAHAAASAAEAEVGLNVETGLGTVKLDAETVGALAAAGEDVTVSVKTNDDGTTTFNVSVGGETVENTFKVELPAPSEGQVLVIVDENGNEEIVKKSIAEDGTVYAEIPAGATVKVVDNEKDFADVSGDAWYAGAVAFSAGRELLRGTGEEAFSPDQNMSRAMMATVLFRLEGAAAAGENPFADVPDGAWYAEAAAWASEQGIIEGTDAGFAPDQDVTREQVATMLYRYVRMLGKDVSGRESLEAFPDGKETSSWAEEAMSWCVSAGLFRGNGDGSLNPKGSATRAEVATLLMRLVALLVK